MHNLNKFLADLGFRKEFKMKTRTITKFYLAVAIIGILLALAAKLLLDEVWTNTQTGAAIGVGAGLFGFGISKFMVGRWEDKNPEIFKQKTIEEKDERNQMIKNKSQAISGEVIHWALMLGAWISIFFDAPLWITLAFVGVFLLKTALDIMFTAYYQKRM